jgi:molybdate transport system regulatory protein
LVRIRQAQRANGASFLFGVMKRAMAMRHWRPPRLVFKGVPEGRFALTHFANVTAGLRFRIVLEPGIAIGPGKADLLQAIDETASLTAAAARFGMSYKRSWSLVRELNAAFAEPLVETEKGGAGGGGGAHLTARGRYVLTRYRKMEADAARAIEAGITDLRKHLARAARPLAD